MKSERKIEQFARFSRRLTKEGLINALLISLAVAFSIVFVVSTVAWFVEKNVLLLCVVIVALVSLI